MLTYFGKCSNGYKPGRYTLVWTRKTPMELKAVSRPDGKVRGSTALGRGRPPPPFPKINDMK